MFRNFVAMPIHAIFACTFALSTISMTTLVAGSETVDVAEFRQKFPSVQLGYIPVHNQVENLPYRDSPQDKAFDEVTDVRIVNGRIELRELIYYPANAFRIVASNRKQPGGRWLHTCSIPGYRFCRYTKSTDDEKSTPFFGPQGREKIVLSESRILFLSGDPTNSAETVSSFPQMDALLFTTDVSRAHRDLLSIVRRQDYSRPDAASCYSHSESLHRCLSQKNCRRLTVLSLPSTSATDDVLMVDVGRLVNLRALSLFFSDVSDEGLELLPACRELQALNLDGCRISNDGLAHLAALKNLRSLSINGCHLVDDKGLQPFFGHPSLMEIRAAGTGITEAGVRSMKAHNAAFRNAWLEDRFPTELSKSNDRPRIFSFP